MCSYTSNTKALVANSLQESSSHLPTGRLLVTASERESMGHLSLFHTMANFSLPLTIAILYQSGIFRPRERVQTLEKVTGHGKWISIFRGRALACTSEGQYLAISFLETDQETVRLWNGETFLSFTPAETPITSAAVSPDGKLFATGGWIKRSPSGM